MSMLFTGVQSGFDCAGGEQQKQNTDLLSVWCFSVLLLLHSNIQLQFFTPHFSVSGICSVLDSVCASGQIAFKVQ